MKSLPEIVCCSSGGDVGQGPGVGSGHVELTTGHEEFVGGHAGQSFFPKTLVIPKYWRPTGEPPVVTKNVLIK